MNIDKNGLIYYTQHDKGEEIIFEKDINKKNPDEISRFYKLNNHPELIIKYAIKNFDNEKVRYMLRTFMELQKRVYLTKLPTSYYMEDGIMKGTIIPYYDKGISLNTVSLTKKIDELMKYYYHDEDILHNLFILFSDIMDILEELVDNNVIYFDTNPGNFVLINNRIQLIDFDPEYDRIVYEVNKKNIVKMLIEFDRLVFLVTKRFGIADLCYYNPRNIQSYRKHLVKIENKIRKG
ncbi:MAG: hypothetical protein J6X02_01060 [Bacilli bacterium]|nr:hypothetical protein [Bacilli bacterium]